MCTVIFVLSLQNFCYWERNLSFLPWRISTLLRLSTHRTKQVNPLILRILWSLQKFILVFHHFLFFIKSNNKYLEKGEYCWSFTYIWFFAGSFRIIQFFWMSHIFKLAIWISSIVIIRSGISAENHNQPQPPHGWLCDPRHSYLPLRPTGGRRGWEWLRVFPYGT